MRKAAAIFKKQVKDTLKNKTVLIQFVLLPVIAVVMQSMVNIPDMPKNYFVILFSTMFVGMAPLTTMTEVLAEEKEKNTLRVLLMSDVKAGEYLLGVGSYIFIMCMAGSGILAIAGQYEGIELLQFFFIMAVGILTSLLAGAAIGTYSRNQMAATSVAVPVMLVLSFLPMLSMFNDSIAKVSRFVFTQQIGNLMNQIGQIAVSFENAAVIGGNLAAALLLFSVAYKKSSLA